MITTNPIQINGQTFDRFSLNLAITGKYNVDGSTDASIACRLIPTRIEDGQVITAEAEAKAIVFGTLEGADADTLQAVGAIQTALQNYLASKGL
jgi:hypothetical protein